MDYKEYGLLKFTDDVKTEVKAEIIDKINILCTGDHANCFFRECHSLLSCSKNDYVVELLPTKKNPLLRLLKHVRKDERKKLNLPPPENKKKVRSPQRQNVASAKKLERQERVAEFHERCRKILGQEVWEHELVIGHTATIESIQKTTSLYVVANILNKRHKEKYGKKVVFGSRSLYFEFQNENKDYGFHIPPWAEQLPTNKRNTNNHHH